MKAFFDIYPSGYVRHVLHIILLFTYSLGIKAQNRIDPGITAASQGQAIAGGVPMVDHSTGIMRYGISLLPHRYGALDLSLNLSYAAKGVKVRQQPSTVGTGWVLAASGAVTRTVRGLPDESGLGRLNHPYVPGTPQGASFLRELSIGMYDGESDIFHIGFNGLNVSFVLERASGNPNAFVAVPLHKSNVRINVELTSTNEISRFVVLDEQGNRYIFREKERVSAHTDGASSSYVGNNTPYVSAWYLNEIECYTGERAIFDYEEDLYSSYFAYTKYHELVFGQSWIEFGQHPDLLADYTSFVNSLGGTQVRRTQLLNYVKNLYEQQDFILRSRYNSTLSEIQEVSQLDRFTQQQLETIQQQIDIFAQQYYDLGAPLPSNQELQYRFHQLATTPSEKYSTAISSPSVSMSRGKLLSRIILNDITYHFYYVTGSGQDQKKRSLLDRVAKVGISGAVLEEVRFTYALTNTTDGSRPFLKQVRSLGDPSTAEDDLVYSFDYQDEGLSYNPVFRDYWGYFNGAVNDFGLLPDIGSILGEIVPEVGIRRNQYLTNSYSGGPLVSLDSTRVRTYEPNPRYASVHTLKTIHLPTGGAYDFYYEGNTVGDIVPINQAEIGSIALGGIRIREIREREGTSVLGVRKFYYDFKKKNGNVPYSTGRYLKKGFLTLDMQIRYAGASIPPDLLWSSEPIDIGSQFTDAGNENIQYSYAEEEISGVPGRVGYSYLPFRPTEESYPYWLEGLLVGKVTYDGQGRIVSMERNRYQARAADVQPYLIDPFHMEHFVSVSSHGFTGRIRQYKAFPFTTGYDTNINNYPNVTDPYTLFNPRTMVYEPNLQPRSNPQLDSMAYVIKYGGRVLLKDSEDWIAIGTGIAPVLNNGEEHYSHRWLFQTGHGPGVSDRTELVYGNPAHPLPTQVLSFGSEGDTHGQIIKRAIDFSPGAASYIDSLKAHNRFYEVLENQSWIKQAGSQQWQMLDARQARFSALALSPQDGHRQRNVMLHSEGYVTDLAAPIQTGQQGWVDSPLSLPPYASTTLGAANVYRVKTENRWKVDHRGVRSSGQRDMDSSVPSAVRENGRDILQVSGADPDEVLLLGYLGERNIVPPMTSTAQLGAGVGGQRIYLRDLRSRMRERPYGPNSQFNTPGMMLALMDSIITCALNKEYPVVFLQDATQRLYDFSYLMTTNPSVRQQFNNYCAQRTDFDEFAPLSIFFYNMFGPTYSYYNFLGEDSDVITSDGIMRQSMPLAGYLAAGKKMQVHTASNASSYTFRFTYTDNTAPYSVSMPTVMSSSGLRTASIDLLGLPSSNKLKALEILGVQNMTTFFLPEGSLFNLKRTDVLGRVIEERDNRGLISTFGYDAHGRLMWTKDQNGQMTGHIRYNLGSNQ